MCGGTDLIKQDGVFVCQYCGMKYSLEDAKKMMIEGTVDVQGTVKVDNSAFVEKYLANARRALQKEDWEEVEKYYNMVEQNAPNNMEAVFFSSFGKAMLSMYDSDYFRREQRFAVLVRSMSVISDYFELTTEDKEDVLNRISTYIDKMYNMNFVYRQQELNLAGAINALTGVTGSKQWCVNLFNAVRNTFLTELKQIQEKHNESYILELINKYNAVVQQQSEPKKKKRTAEQELKMVSNLMILPFSCVVGFFVLFWARKNAKDENGGALSEKGEQYFNRGLIFGLISVIVTIFIFSLI